MLNFGKRGITLSTGIRGASVTLSNNGVWSNVALPGTGMSYRTRLSDSSSHQRRVDRHHQEQLVQVDKFLEITSKDHSWMLEVLSAKLSDLDWPRETLVDFDISVEDQTVFIDVDSPTLEAFLTQSTSLSFNEQRLVIKNNSDRQIRQEYANYVHGVIMRLIGVVFALLPAINKVQASGYTQILNHATGHDTDHYLISVEAHKSIFTKLNFSEVEPIDPVASLDLFELRRDMTKTGIFRSITPMGHALR